MLVIIVPFKLRFYFMKSFKKILQEATIDDLKKYRILFDTSPEATILTTHDGKILDCNKSAINLYGYTRKEMLQLTARDLMTNDITDKSPENLTNEHKRDGFISRGTNKKKNGEIFSVEIFTKLIEVNDNTFRWTTIHDLTYYKDPNDNTIISDEKIKDMAQLLPELIGEPEIIIETDLKGYIKYVNRLFFEKSGYTKDDIEKGLKFEQLLLPELRKEAKKRFKKNLKGEFFEINEYTGLRKDGSTLPVMVFGKRIESNGQIKGALIFAIDITAHKRIEKDLVNMEKFHVLGEMSGGVIHDINNILTMILGYVEIASKKDYKHHECIICKKIIDKIKQAALDGSQIVKRIQNSTHLSKEQQCEPINMNEVVDEVVELLRPKWDNNYLTREINLNVVKKLNPIPPVTGNSAELREVLSNIIINSIESMPHGGSIIINTSLDNEYVIVSVSDTGTGLSEETKLNIFKPFFTTKDKGTGIGLYVSQSIAKKFGGDIMFESKEGDGTIFKVSLPALKEKEAKKPRVPLSATGTKKFNFLIIDDEINICDLLTDFLTTEGHTVNYTQNGKEGLVLFETHLQDIVITDLNIPEMSGLEIARLIKEKSPKTIIIMLTGENISTEKINKEKELIDYFLYKPIDFRKLSQVINQQ